MGYKKGYKRFVIGDIHGANKAILQCFEKSGYDEKNDLLICLGDICDGWPDVNDAFETILKSKNLIYILGNHDFWALEWMKTGYSEDIWLRQGGWATIKSYEKKIPESHKFLLSNALYYFEIDNMLFVHGGFDPATEIEKQNKHDLLWDRSLVKTVMGYYINHNDHFHLSKYKEVFVGHTPTLNFNTIKPIKACEVWIMDTGAGWSGGVLTMMNIDTKEVYQSERTDLLYPEFPGRH